MTALMEGQLPTLFVLPQSVLFWLDPLPQPPVPFSRQEAIQRMSDAIATVFSALIGWAYCRGKLKSGVIPALFLLLLGAAVIGVLWGRTQYLAADDLMTRVETHLTIEEPGQQAAIKAVGDKVDALARQQQESEIRIRSQVKEQFELLAMAQGRDRRTYSPKEQ